jgi:hypothetical protein
MLFKTGTICLPSVMVDMIDGLKASPENRTRGWSAL